MVVTIVLVLIVTMAILFDTLDVTVAEPRIEELMAIPTKCGI